MLEEFDTNSDGNITSAEALAGFQAQADEQVDQIIEKFDANDDGSVTAAEIRAVRPARRLASVVRRFGIG